MEAKTRMRDTTAGIRTCVVCKTARQKTDLIRWVSSPKGIMPDWRSVMPGRAMYSCGEKNCVEGVYALKRFPARFHEGAVSWVISREDISAFMHTQAVQSCRHYLSLMMKKRDAVIGQNSVLQALDGQMSFDAILVAHDAAERTKRLMHTEDIPQVRFSSSRELGAWTRGEPVAVIGLKPGALADRLRYYIDLTEIFGQE